MVKAKGTAKVLIHIFLTFMAVLWVMPLVFTLYNSSKGHTLS